MLCWKVYPLWLLAVCGQVMPLAFAGVALARPPLRRDQFGDALPEASLARMGTIRLRHGDVINTLSFSPDGKMLASGGGAQADWDIHLWNPDTGKLVRLLDPDSTVDALAFSPDGRMLASVGGDRSIQVWEVSTGRSLYRHRDGVWSMAFTPDGKSLALGYTNGVISVLDARTGKETRRLRMGEQTVTSIAYSPDAKLLASANYSNVVNLWDIASGKVLHQWIADRDGNRLAFSPDGKTLATWGGSSAIYRFSVPSARPLGRLVPKTGEMVRAAMYSPDGRFFVTVDDLTAHLWDMVSRKELPVGWNTGRSLRAAAFTPDGKRVAFAGEDHCIRFWETATAHECTPSLGGHLRPVVALAVSPEATWLASADDGDDGQIRTWNPNTGKQLRLFQARSPVGALALSPRGDTLVSASHYTLHRWDPLTGQPRHQLVSHTGPLSGPSPPHYLSFSADGKHLLVHSYFGGLCYLDVHNDKPTRELRKDFQYAALSPDGNTVGGVLHDRVQFWDLATRKQRHNLEGHGGNLLCVAFSPDGRLMATSELLWDVEEGKLLRRFAVHGDSDCSIYSAAFSPDSKTLVTGTTSGYVQLWEVETGKERRRFAGHRGIVNAVAFCRSGQAVVSGSADTSLLLWDVAGRLSLDDTTRTTLTIEQLKDLCTTLGNADARKAYDALCTLAASPTGVSTYVINRIRSRFRYERDQVEKWIAQLDDDQFAVRENATRKLEEFGDRAEPDMQLALTRSSSLEQRRRVQLLLILLHTSAPPPDRIFAFRTVELLERIGTAEAREGLQMIAKESPKLIRRNAEAALQRLARKTSPTP